MPAVDLTKSEGNRGTIRDDHPVQNKPQAMLTISERNHGKIEFLPHDPKSGLRPTQYIPGSEYVESVNRLVKMPFFKSAGITPGWDSG